MDPKEQLSKQQKAVLYIRMSTDHQKYSPDNQKAFLLEYANKNGLTVVGEFIDEGISGVVTQKRYQFLNLIDLVRTRKNLVITNTYVSSKTSFCTNVRNRFQWQQKSWIR